MTNSQDPGKIWLQTVIPTRGYIPKKREFPLFVKDHKGERHLNWDLLILVLKIAIGSTLAIVVAQMLDLQYATSAGVITLLTIQNTRRATFDLAIKRIISLFFTIALASLLCIQNADIVLCFGSFMLVLVFVSYLFGWEGALSVNSVIGAQVLVLESAISLEFALNEAMIVFIGIAIAVVLNLWMVDKREEIKGDMHMVEEKIQGIMAAMVRHLLRQEKLREDKGHIVTLIEGIETIMEKAMDNMDNTLSDHSQYFIEYLNMRKSQCVVLLQVTRTLRAMDMVPDQAKIVATFMEKVSGAVHETDNAKEMIQELEIVLKVLENKGLPKTQEAFESQAMMFLILKELEEFLRLKRNFVRNTTKEQMAIYWETPDAKKI